MGSSNNHVVRFDGVALRLDGEGLCSYTILTVSRGIRDSSEVKLHSGPCPDSASYNHVCMTAMEVMYGERKLLLKDDMTVRFAGERVSGLVHRQSNCSSFADLPGMNSYL